jgi:quercetin dioxygenase-like cupin family protein
MREPHLINATPRNGDYLELLSGPPQSVAMRSGYVTLPAGASVGWHTTGAREELIIVLAGAGEARFRETPAIAVGAGAAAYVPPQCEHNMVNTGPEPLRYIYVVAPAVPLPSANSHAQ